MSNKVLSLPLVVAALTTLVVALLLAGPGVSANDGGASPDPQQQELTYHNLGSLLDAVVASYESGRQSKRQAAEQGELYQDNSIAVYVILNDNTAGVVDFLDDNGASVRNVSENFIEAYVPVSVLGEASQQAGVIRVRQISPPSPDYGPVTSQGFELHKAKAWFDSDYTGQGVKVGIIDRFHRWQELQGKGELPGPAGVQCYYELGHHNANLDSCATRPGESTTSDHGTSAAEALIDIAPGVSLYLANPTTVSDYRETVEWMAVQGVRVISHSQSYSSFIGPGDGTSPYSRNPYNYVDDAVSSGIVWVNSAGNDAGGNRWYGLYSDTNQNNIHQWNGTDEYQTINLKEGDETHIYLRWDDLWGGATLDLDVLIYKLDGNSRTLLTAPVAKGGQDRQNGGPGDWAVEDIEFTAPSDGVYEIEVRLHSGTAPRWLQLGLSDRGIDLEHHTPDHNVNAPADSKNLGLLGVGAAHYWDINTIASYSNQGPTTDGREKPDIVGVACAQTASDEPNPWDGYNCWSSGTSQAASHVAGLAALVAEQYRGFSPEQIANYLKTNAVDRGAAGADNVWGSGFAQLPSPPECVESLTADGTTNGTWTSGCQSQVASPDPADASGAKGYAKYYTFTTTEQKAVTITLDSDDTPTAVDTYLYLRPGAAKSGTATARNDDHGRRLNNAAACADTSGLEHTDSCITVSALPAGSYTIEATTYKAATTGTFTLKISGLGSSGGGPTPAPTDTCTDAITADGSTSGTWAAGCDSQAREGRYARYYSFTTTEDKAITITLDSDTDPYLYLRSGGKTGAVAAQNDDHGDLLPDTAAPIPVACANTTGLGQRDSCITITSLPAGSYTIEATTYRANEAGSFTLTVSGLSTGGGGPTPPPTDTCAATALTADGTTSGTWGSDCDSQAREGRYARYYSFTTTEAGNVTITLDSDTDPYLYLRSGGKTGSVAAENDDHGTLDNTAACANATGLGERDSCITVLSLSAGSYTIEATTYDPGKTGSFTLTVSGLGTAPATACAVGNTLTPGQSCTGQDFTATVKSNGNLSMEFTGTAAPPSGLSFTRSGNNWTVAGLP